LQIQKGCARPFANWKNCGSTQRSCRFKKENRAGQFFRRGPPERAFEKDRKKKSRKNEGRHLTQEKRDKIDSFREGKGPDQKLGKHDGKRTFTRHRAITKQTLYKPRESLKCTERGKAEDGGFPKIQGGGVSAPVSGEESATRGKADYHRNRASERKKPRRVERVRAARRESLLFALVLSEGPPSRKVMGRAEPRRTASRRSDARLR